MRLFSNSFFSANYLRWKRRGRECLFRVSGLLSLSFVMGTLFSIVALVCLHGYTAFISTEIHVTLHFPEPITPQTMHKHLTPKQIHTHLAQAFSKNYPFLDDQSTARDAAQIVSWREHKTISQKMQKKIQEQGSIKDLKIWVLASDEADSFYKGKTVKSLYNEKRLSTPQALTLQGLTVSNKIRLKFNGNFLTGNNATLPELAGIWGAFWGSFWTLVVSLLFALPLGLGTALYLEEIAPPTKWWNWVDIQLNNLASIPSILFGLLTFMLFDYWLNLPRPSPLLGGLAIGMMMAPLLMVTTRVALQTVPKSIRIAARALGASHAQIILDHVLPLAFPQIVAGSLLTSVRALGETAPVLMVGMVAFVGNTPQNLSDAATTLPAQIFSWSKSAELGFLTKTTGGMLALFFLLFVLNGLAFWLRRHFQRNV